MPQGELGRGGPCCWVLGRLCFPWSPRLGHGSHHPHHPHPPHTRAGGLQQGPIQPRGQQGGFVPRAGGHGTLPLGLSPGVPTALGDPLAPAPAAGPYPYATYRETGRLEDSPTPSPAGAFLRQQQALSSQVPGATLLQGQPRPHKPFLLTEATPARLWGRRVMERRSQRPRAHRAALNSGAG